MAPPAYAEIYVVWDFISTSPYATDRDGFKSALPKYRNIKKNSMV
jgi:hypothetical protein